MATEKHSFIMPHAVWKSVKCMYDGETLNKNEARSLMYAAVEYGMTGSIPGDMNEDYLDELGFEMIKTLIDNANDEFVTPSPGEWHPTPPRQKWIPTPPITCDDEVKVTPLPYKPSTTDSTNIPNNQKRISWSNTTAVADREWEMPVTYCTCDDKTGLTTVEDTVTFKDPSEFEDFFINKY